MQELNILSYNYYANYRLILVFFMQTKLAKSYIKFFKNVQSNYAIICY